MEILRSFPRGDLALSPREVAGRTGIALPTVYRLMGALVEHGMLEKSGGRYRLGVSLLYLGGRVAGGMEVRRQALPHLEWLNAGTGENAELHVRRREARIPVELVQSAQNLRPIVEIGEPIPLHLGAAGKVLLAWLPEERWDGLARMSAERFGDADFDAVDLRARLRKVRATGWSATDGERSPGVAALAAPIFGADGGVAGAMVLSAPSVRLPARQRRKLVPMVREAAARASNDLGYAGGPSTGETA